MTRLLPAALLGLLILVSGCSADADEETAPAPGGEESTSQVLTINGVSFEAPQGWTSLESSKVLEGTADSEQVEEFAERTRMTTEQLEETMQQGVALTVISDERTDNFLDNIVVTTSEGAGTATEDELRQEYESMGAEVGSFELVETDSGDAVRVRYELETSGVLVMGESLNVVSGDDLVSITVSSLDAGTSAELTDNLLASLKVA